MPEVILRPWAAETKVHSTRRKECRRCDPGESRDAEMAVEATSGREQVECRASMQKDKLEYPSQLPCLGSPHE